MQGRVTGIRAVGVFTEAAGPGTEDLALLGQERLPQEGLLATGAAETGIGGVPVLALVGHLTLVNTCKEETRPNHWMGLRTLFRNPQKLDGLANEGDPSHLQKTHPPISRFCKEDEAAAFLKMIKSIL